MRGKLPPCLGGREMLSPLRHLDVMTEKNLRPSQLFMSDFRVFRAQSR